MSDHKKIGSYPQRILFKLFDACEAGILTVRDPFGQDHVFQGAMPGHHATLILKEASCCKDILTRGDIGLGESYMKGEWETPDLPRLLTYFVDNVSAIERVFHGHKLGQIILGLQKLLTRNTKRGSQKNIKAHYDLGNDFYALWLDPSMTYSSGIFLKPEASLEEAQAQKYGRILEHLPASTRHILEIGCGWGGFCERAAQKQLTVHALTLSPSQAQYAKDRLRQKNLDGYVNIDLRDYRDVHDKYDAIVSIEMFEAVGRSYWPQYFETVKKCLKPGGKAVIQTITIHDEIYDGYGTRTDFIQKHIFPGGMLPSDVVFRSLAQAAGLRVVDAYAFGLSYAKTLTHWLERFDAVRPQVRAMGFDEAFIAKWRFYLAYCIAGFESGRTNVYQYVLDHQA